MFVLAVLTAMILAGLLKPLLIKVASPVRDLIRRKLEYARAVKYINCLRYGRLDLLQEDWDSELQARWLFFQEACKEQEAHRALCKEIGGSKAGLEASEIDRLFYRGEDLEREVAFRKKNFWELHAAARVLGKRTWPKGEAYAALRKTEL
jgi:hypothetical protein